MADVVFSVGLGNIPQADIQRVRRQASAIADAQEQGRRSRRQTATQEASLQRASIQGLDRYTQRYQQSTRQITQFQTRAHLAQRRGQEQAQRAVIQGSRQQAQAEARGFSVNAYRPIVSLPARVASNQVRSSQQQIRQTQRAAQQQARAEARAFNQRIVAQRQFNARAARQQLAASAQQRRVAAQASSRGIFTGGLAASGAAFGVATGGVLALGVALTSGVRRLAQFEQAMSTVRAVTGASAEEFQALREESQRLGATTRFTATQAGEGMLFLARAGLEASEVLTATADTLLLAQAGALDMARAADIATNILKGFRLEATDLARVVDVLALAANSSNQSVEQLGAAMSFIAPVSQSLGISVEETAAALGVLANAGIQGERGGTGLRRVLLALLDPTAKAREAISDLGLSLADLNVRELGVGEVFRRFQEAGAGIEEFAQIFSTRGAGIANVLAQSSEELNTFTGELDNAGGSAQEIATIMDDNLYGALLRVASAFESLLLAIGDAGVTTFLTETFNGLAEALRFVSGGLDNLIENFRLKRAAQEQATQATAQATQREKEYAAALQATAVADNARRGTIVQGVGPTAAFSTSGIGCFSA